MAAMAARVRCAKRKRTYVRTHKREIGSDQQIKNVAQAKSVASAARAPVRVVIYCFPAYDSLWPYTSTAGRTAGVCVIRSVNYTYTLGFDSFILIHLL